MLDPLEYLPQYRILRSQQPIRVYWDVRDPLNFGHAFEENTEVAARLTSYLAIAFGRAWRDFSDCPEATTDKEALTSLFDNLSADILKAVAETSRCLGAGMGHLKSDAEGMSASFASAIIFFNTVALREFAWQRGFLMRKFEIHDVVKDAAMSGYDENKLNQEVLGAVMKAINDEVRLFPDSEQAIDD